MDHEFTMFVSRMKESRNINVRHEEAMHGAVELEASHIIKLISFSSVG